MSSREWKNVKVGDVCESVSKTHRIIKDRMVLVNTSDILDGVVLNHELSETKGMPGQFKKSIMKGDILFSEIRPKNKRYAFIQFEPKDYICSTKLMVIRNKHNIDNSFLYYYLTSKEILDYLQVQAEGRSGTFPQITFSNISEMQIGLPPLFEQKAIVDTLSCLDDMIELNNRTNKVLEEMAQAIFKRWFVDFEFPNEDGKPYKSSGGEMVDSELGEIPKGWRVGTLGDIAVNSDSQRVPLSGQQRAKMEKKYPYYGAASLMDYVDDYLFDGIYLLLGEDGTVITVKGNPILQYVWGKFWVNNHAHILQGKIPFSTEYLYVLLKTTNINNIVTGAVQQKINQGNLNRITVLIPCESVLGTFNRSISKVFELYRSNLDQNKTVCTIRDTLLPKLISGQIRVPVEEVV